MLFYRRYFIRRDRFFRNSRYAEIVNDRESPSNNRNLEIPGVCVIHTYENKSSMDYILILLL